VIIIDENVDQTIIEQLSAAGYQVYSIREKSPGIADQQIIRFASAQQGILVTEDKDFGELVFSHNIKGCTTILLRYGKPDINRIKKNLLLVIEKHDQLKDNHFVTITPKKIRVRKI